MVTLTTQHNTRTLCGKDLRKKELQLEISLLFDCVFIPDVLKNLRIIRIIITLKLRSQ